MIAPLTDDQLSSVLTLTLIAFFIGMLIGALAGYIAGMKSREIEKP
jgi:ABC-type dipeptide/oligopeptide/nickel transport system permease subunit